MARLIYSPVYSVLFGPDLLFFLANECVECRWTIAGSLLEAFLLGPSTHQATSSISLLLILYFLASPSLHEAASPLLFPALLLISYTKQCTPLPVHLGCCSHPFLSMLSLLRCLPVRPAWETILERKRQARQGQGVNEEERRWRWRRGGWRWREDGENNVERR